MDGGGEIAGVQDVQGFISGVGIPHWPAILFLGLSKASTVWTCGLGNEGETAVLRVNNRVN